MIMFEKLTNLVIAYLEGGYYHPDMKAKLKGGDAMGDSGETMCLMLPRCCLFCS